MKKGFFVFTLALSMILCCSNGVLAEGALRFGYSFNERMTADISKDVGLGLDLSFELTTDGNGFESGFGVEYQRPRTLQDDSMTFQFIPVYGVFALEVSDTETNNTYLLGKCGLSYLRVSDLPETASTRMGYYYAVGFGMKIGPYIRTQALYEVCNGSVSNGALTDYTNTAYTFKFGYAF